MIISYYGEGCFKIQSGDFTILTDPFDAKSGLMPPRFKADLVIKTFSPFPLSFQQDNSVTQSIVGPGEYNLKDADITGFVLKKESAEKFLKTVYIIKLEGLRLCLLGHISELPGPEIAERLEEIDVLFIPAGGKPFLNQESAVKFIKQIEPKIVIPTFFKVPALKRSSADLKVFLEEFGYSPKNGALQTQEKLTIKKKDADAIKKTELIPLKL